MLLDLIDLSNCRGLWHLQTATWAQAFIVMLGWSFLLFFRVYFSALLYTVWYDFVIGWNNTYIVACKMIWSCFVLLRCGPSFFRSCTFLVKHFQSPPDSTVAVWPQLLLCCSCCCSVTSALKTGTTTYRLTAFGDDGERRRSRGVHGRPGRMSRSSDRCQKRRT